MMRPVINIDQIELPPRPAAIAAPGSVTERYPDSGKFLVTENQREADGSVRGFRHVGRAESAVDYWDGE
jgi:hypothetical protein